MVRWVTEQKDFCKSKSNIFDTALLFLFAGTLLFLVIYGEGNEKELLDTDDIIILVIVISRYFMQVIRMFCILKTAKKNREMHAQMKKIDLNALEMTHNNSLNFHDMHKAEQLVRGKMAQRH